MLQEQGWVKKEWVFPLLGNKKSEQAWGLWRVANEMGKRDEGGSVGQEGSMGTGQNGLGVLESLSPQFNHHNHFIARPQVPICKMGVIIVLTSGFSQDYMS